MCRHAASLPPSLTAAGITPLLPFLQMLILTDSVLTQDTLWQRGGYNKPPEEQKATVFLPSSLAHSKRRQDRI
ncbi:hypothetical protein CgunFtcFv8_021370 [Champsocephalus gunnari]|uniref:Uncharacterized protein n=1 Tax=Champsocephalus gunnari TaxID=52237 RepID=A0AAN8EAK5_CHAGU|nr:hypothetical protein CgunFtcFv8_021370 [Champsocephalus gunnari]